MKPSQIHTNIILTLFIVFDLLFVVIFRRVNSLEASLKKLNKTSINLNFLDISLQSIYRKHKKILVLLNLKNCQTQSFSLYRTASRFGIKPELNIGINTLHKFSSHAWLEHEGHKYYFDKITNFSVIHKI